MLYVKPGIAESDSRIIKIIILSGFASATYGFGAVAMAIILNGFNRLNF